MSVLSSDIVGQTLTSTECQIVYLCSLIKFNLTQIRYVGLVFKV